MERGRVRKYPTTEFYACKDFVVGKTVTLYGHSFEITEADEKTRQFTVDNPELYE